MSTITKYNSRWSALDLPDLLRRAWAANWPLTLVGLGMIPVLLAALIGIVVDPRLITGQPAWLKPAKFAISISIYSFTFIWMLGFVQGRRPRRLAGIAASLTALAFVVEILVIVLQVVRGVGSHFNMATPLDAALFSIMGNFIVLLWAMSLLLAGVLLLQRLPDPALAWGLNLGLLIGAVGMALAFVMPMPTEAQQAALAAGEPVAVIGAHAVGAPDDAPGLPVLGWSTSGGDLRVAHFIGLHGMQAMPLVAWLLGWLGAAWLGARHRAALVIIAGLAYLGIVLLTFWQALRGQPLLAPDGLTLAALAGLVAATAVAAGATLLHARAGRRG